MLQFEELRSMLKEQKGTLKDLEEALGIEAAKDEISKLEQMTMADGFWSDQRNSADVLQKIKMLKEKGEKFRHLQMLFDDAETLIAMSLEAGDESFYDETKQAVELAMLESEALTLSTMLSGEYDNKDAVLTFHAGAGGTEAQDWVEMLYRMYTMWAEKHKFKYKLLDYLDGDEAGIKSASILIEGANAYGYLKCETGVHRLVRISPFDSSGRRHTSFASLEVMPMIDSELEVVIDDEDLRIDTYRSGGAGGQHVNKTESAVRITHIPTGIVAACQNERSQVQNKAMALKMLKSKLVEIKEREHLEKIEDIKGVQKDIAWGNQIRSYVFMPYTLVKDHRTGFEMGNVDAVMNGELDGFITAYLKALSRGDQ